ncbi:MAG: hypothetical protein K6G16_11365, partial [Lachnospiraceae bacterium]|nr:hypothetical protein [Lachnospiraceae bacterium]
GSAAAGSASGAAGSAAGTSGGAAGGASGTASGGASGGTTATGGGTGHQFTGKDIKKITDRAGGDSGGGGKKDEQQRFGAAPAGAGRDPGQKFGGPGGPGSSAMDGMDDMDDLGLSDMFGDTDIGGFIDGAGDFYDDFSDLFGGDDSGADMMSGMDMAMIGSDSGQQFHG